MSNPNKTKCVCRLAFLYPQILKSTGPKGQKYCRLVGFSSWLVCIMGLLVIVCGLSVFNSRPVGCIFSRFWNSDVKTSRLAWKSYRPVRNTYRKLQVKVADCTVHFPGQSVCHQVQSGSKCLRPAGYMIQTGLFH